MSGHDLISEMREGGKLPPARSARGGALDLILILVVVAAVGSAGYFGLTHWLRQGAPQPNSPPPVGEMVSAGSVTDVAWTDADAARCAAKGRAAANAPLPGEMALANPAVTEGFSGFATRLDCYLTTKVDRFCDPENKAALVAAINDYLSRIDLVEIGLGVQGAPMALLGGMMGGEVAAGSTIYDEQHAETLAFMATYNARIATDLQGLVRNGVVTSTDFSVFMGGVPKTIGAMIGTATPQHNLCA